MSWFTIVENIRMHKCRTHQNQGGCDCQSKRRGWNPCDRAESFACSAECYYFGEPAEHSVEELYDYLKHQVCHTPGCKHSRCQVNRECLVFLQQKMMKVAA